MHANRNGFALDLVDDRPRCPGPVGLWWLGMEWLGCDDPRDALRSQGAGQFAMGAGVYNLDTAQARSINADTAVRWNQYAYLSTMEQGRRYAERKHAEFQKNRALYHARQKQLRDNPSNRDIETGDALNVAVADLSDPRLGSAALRAAKVTVPASLIATVPFVYASERVTLMLDDLRTSVKWPEVFDGERFAKDQETFDDLRSRIRQAADAGDVSAKILREAKGFVQDLRAKVEAQPLKDPDHQKEALRFLTACSSLLGLLEKPNIGPALLEIRKIQDTMVGNLLGFMHAFNLRFGAAKTPTERQAFHQLFAILDQTRDQILAEARLDNSTAPPTRGTRRTSSRTWTRDVRRGGRPRGLLGPGTRNELLDAVADSLGCQGIT